MLQELLTNRILWVALGGWGLAEVLKTIIYWIVNKRLDWSRLVGDGGYPSAHSALVTALAISTAKYCGLGSSQFALAAVLACIVMHDAHGVRLQSSKQAQTLNSLLDLLLEKQWLNIPNERLKEMIGHTPLQVFSGAVVGAAVGLLF